MRYLIFRIKYSQWFKNHEGIKGFAHQCMNWLLQSVLKLAAKLKKQNMELAEKIKELSKELDSRLLHPIIDADDFATLRNEIRNYTVLEWVIIIAETFFNIFAAKAIFSFPGWGSVVAQVIFALAITWISIPLFRNLFHHIIYEPNYKSQQKEPRSFKKLFFVLIPVAIIYEFGMYSLCKLRGEQIEGGSSGFITIMMIVIGMLLPVIAGYFIYERNRYYSPYKNTLCIDKLKKTLAKNNNMISANSQKMETHFKQICQKYWAYFQEFKNYKENYNLGKSIPKENLIDHYSNTYNSFIEEAIERYVKEAILHKESKTGLNLTPTQLNGHDAEIKEIFNNQFFKSDLK